ncbi:MAG: hypothetical protein J7M18_02975 [Candidatus Eremiobacteraeota bacterium]|nr:hypothetical protein [Candidatus Eremiobacteraeota bacterium]
MKEMDAFSQALEILHAQINKISPFEKAALLLGSLPPEIMIEASMEFSETDIKRILPEIGKVFDSFSIEVDAVIDEFLRLHGLWPMMEQRGMETELLSTKFSYWAKRNPRRLGRLLKASWLMEY